MLDAANSPVALEGSELEPTLHACARYAELVLGRRVHERDLLRDAKLLGRCARGLQRLADKAQPEPERLEEAGRTLLLVGTRALVLQGRRIMTLLVAPPRGFSKRLLRDPDLVAA